jgi:hypothetical protein
MRMQSGVIFDGGSISGNGPFRLGTLDGLPGAPSAPTTLITIDFAGATVQNYILGGDGLVKLGWVQTIEIKNLKVRNCSGDASLSHCVYVESDQAHRGSGVIISDLDIVGPVSKALNGVQVYAHDTPTGTTGVQVIRGVISSLNRGIFAYSDATGFVCDGLSMSNVSVPIESSVAFLNQITGTVKNTTATGSGTSKTYDSPHMTNGGGNSGV